MKAPTLPASARARLEQALGLERFGRHAEALQVAERLLRSHPRHPHLLNLVGVLASQCGQHQKAVHLLAVAVDLEPDNAAYRANRARALARSGQPHAALASFDKALALRPDFADAHCHRGLVLKDLGRFDEALASLETAVALAPGMAAAHLNLAHLLLQLGSFERGFAEYEWRLPLLPATARKRYPDDRRWRGEPAATPGRRLLLHAEQGLGDTLMFCRFAAQAAARGYATTLVVPRRLVPLVGSLGGGAAVQSEDDPTPAFDRHCPLPSLPHVLGVRREADIATATPYLHVDENRLAAWQARLGAATRPRVGIAWRSGTAYAESAARDVPLADCLAALGVPAAQVQLVSLQKEPSEDDRRILAAHPEVLHFGDEQHDLADAAALCAQMDLVISVDTSVAHLAGALGRPTCVLLRHLPDWRWLLERADSPWYPGMRLFRQHARGDWSGPLAGVREVLQTLTR